MTIKKMNDLGLITNPPCKPVLSVDEASAKIRRRHCHIDGQDKCQWVTEGFGTCDECEYETLIKAAESVKTGHWIHRNDDHCDWLECSECGYGEDGEVKYDEDTPYCPMCGAKMEYKEK